MAEFIELPGGCSLTGDRSRIFDKLVSLSHILLKFQNFKFKTDQNLLRLMISKDKQLTILINRSIFTTII